MPSTTTTIRSQASYRRRRLRIIASMCYLSVPHCAECSWPSVRRVGDALHHQISPRRWWSAAACTPSARTPCCTRFQKTLRDHLQHTRRSSKEPRVTKPLLRFRR